LWIKLAFMPPWTAFCFQLDLNQRSRPAVKTSPFVFMCLQLFIFAALASSAHSQQASDITGTLPDAPRPDLSSPNSSTPDDSNAEDKAPLTLKRLPLRFLRDEIGIVTSPGRIHRDDLKWLLPLAGATATSLATDTYTMRNVVSKNTSFNDANATASDALRGVAIGVPVLLLGAGQLTHNEHTRETGLLAGEAMIDAYAFDAAVKYATLRDRPYSDNARGHFFAGSSSSDPSFVSGHSIVAWSSAAVLASEYNRPWQQAGIYTLATGVSLSRVLAQQHFPTDVLLGSVAGWLIGHYVYRTHHWPHKSSY
jgi:membrane-associated phospholipid phosphatase